MKVLGFDHTEQAKEYFQVIYQGFTLGVPDGGLRGLEQTRRAFKLMGKLEAISEPLLSTGEKPEPLFYQTGDAVRILKEVKEGEKLSLEIEDAELMMLNTHLENHKWPLRLAKLRIDTEEFISKA